MTKNANTIHQEKMSLIEKAALRITKGVGTMTTFFLFCGLAFVSFPAAMETHDVITIVSWIAQTFLQLVLLPLLMVGQNLQGRAGEIRNENDYEIDLKTEAEIQDIQSKLDSILKKI